MLKQAEERKKALAEYHEGMREQAREERNWLEKHHQDMLKRALEEQDQLAKHHEEMRERAQESSQYFVQQRDAVANLSPEERATYFKEHFEEMRKRAREDAPWGNGNDYRANRPAQAPGYGHYPPPGGYYGPRGYPPRTQ